MTTGSSYVDSVRAQLEACARKFHHEMNAIGSPYHKFWGFENCPAESCTESRKALGLPEQPLEFAADNREPGQ